MAKCSQKIVCLFAWLRERKLENGLTRKRSKKEEEEDEQRKIYRAMNRLVTLLLLCLIMSCGPSKEKVMEDWLKKRDSIAKHESDSTVERLDFIIQACKAGSSEQKANALYDSLYKENINFIFPFSTGGK